MQAAMSQNEQAAARVQCPYTASNCPLFNPSFTVEEVFSAARPAKEEPTPFLNSPADVSRRPPSLVESMRRDSAFSTVYADSLELPSVSHYYTDYSIAPSPVTGSTSHPSFAMDKPTAAVVSSSAFQQGGSPGQSTQQRSPAPTLSFSPSVPYSPVSAFSAASFATNGGNSASSISAANTNRRRDSLPMPAMSYAVPPSSLTGTPQHPSPGRLVGQSGGYSYERRRQSVEEDVVEGRFGPSALSAAATAAGLGGDGLTDAAVAYELAGLAGVAAGTPLPSPLPPPSFPPFQPSQPAQQRRTSYGGLVMPKVGPSGSYSRAPPMGGPPLGFPAAVGTEVAPSPQFEAELEDLKEEEEDEEEGIADDDEADADYVEDGGRKRRRSSTIGFAASTGSVDGHQESMSNEQLVVPQIMAESVTPFISKLYHLLSNPIYSDVIRWSGDGACVLYVHTSQRLLDTLSRFFRHSNLQSFSRQMNIYGFRRLSISELLSTLENSPPSPEASSRDQASASDWSGFTHPLFFRDGAGEGGGPCDLSKMKPMGPKTEQGRQNLAKKKAEGERKKRKGGGAKSTGKGGDKPGGVRKGGVKQ